MKHPLFRLLPLALWLLAGCGSPPERLPFPRGAVVMEGPLWLAPDRDWGWTDQRSLWLFRGSARILFIVGQEGLGEEGVTVLLRPAGETEGHAFRVEWNGEPLQEKPLIPNAAGDLSIQVPAERLRPGRHALRLARQYRPGDGGHDNTFEQLTVIAQGESRVLELDDLLLQRQVADFLDLGVTGEGLQKQGGILFLGPGERPLPIQAAHEGYLEMQLQNFASEEATFHIRQEGHRHSLPVAAGGRRSLRLAVPAGERRLQLEVEGPERGAYLWGAPYLDIASEEERPTPVFLITLDTTRRDALSPYNERVGALDLTPHLAAFAQGATVYEQAYSTAPWTLPSHSSMMTGLYPSNHGAGVTEAFLPGRFPTLAAILGAQGYRTAGFVGGKLASHTFGVGQGFDLYRNPDSFETIGDRLTDYLVSFLDEHHRKDLFVFANYFDPHALYQAPEPFQEKAKVEQHRAALVGKPFWEAFDQGSNGAWRQIIDGVAAPVDEGIGAYLEAAYWAEVSFMDQQLGRFFAALQRHDLYDRALIILVADHGELLGEHGGLVSHAGRLDPELVEIPLLIKYPFQEEGERVEAIASQVDILPTVLQVLGLPPVEGIDGRPLPRAGVRGAEPDPRRALILEEHESRVHPLPPRLRLEAHVYGVQQLLQRQVVWKGAGECATRDEVDGAWLPGPCQRPSDKLLERLEAELGAKGKVEAAGVLSKEQEEGLKALGYL